MLIKPTQALCPPSVSSRHGLRSLRNCRGQWPPGPELSSSSVCGGALSPSIQGAIARRGRNQMPTSRTPGCRGEGVSILGEESGHWCGRDTADVQVAGGTFAPTRTPGG